jgi:hypothetical protein
VGIADDGNKDGQREGMKEKRVEIMSKDEMPKKEIKARSFLHALLPLLRKNRKEREKERRHTFEHLVPPLFSVHHDRSSAPLSIPFLAHPILPSLVVLPLPVVVGS